MRWLQFGHHVSVSSLKLLIRNSLDEQLSLNYAAAQIVVTLVHTTVRLNIKDNDSW